MATVEHVLSAQNILGEGPLWNVEEQRLYWVDIYHKSFSRFTPSDGSYETIDVGVPIGVLAFRASGGLVMATKRGFALWDEGTRELTYLYEPEMKLPGLRFNDGAVDVGGRFWAGTMNDASDSNGTEGTLYRLDPDGSVHEMEHALGTPNGIGWSLDQATMYFTDSVPRIIYAYDYDAATGDISNRRPFIKVPKETGTPDGLTVDNEGYIWSACWDGAKLVRYAPDGSVDSVIEVPAQRPTSCVFAGPNLDELYITSASTGLSSELRQKYPLSGDIFRLKTGVSGSAERRFGG